MQRQPVAWKRWATSSRSASARGGRRVLLACAEGLRCFAGPEDAVAGHELTGPGPPQGYSNTASAVDV